MSGKRNDLHKVLKSYLKIIKSAFEIISKVYVKHVVGHPVFLFFYYMTLYRVYVVYPYEVTALSSEIDQSYVRSTGIIASISMWSVC